MLLNIFSQGLPIQSITEGFLLISESRIKMSPEVATVLRESAGPRKPQERKQARREVERRTLLTGLWSVCLTREASPVLALMGHNDSAPQPERAMDPVNQGDDKGSSETLPSLTRQLPAVVFVCLSVCPCVAIKMQ